MLSKYSIRVCSCILLYLCLFHDAMPFTLQVGYIAESTDDEADGIEHIEKYFQYMNQVPNRSINVTTFRLDEIEKERNWPKLAEQIAMFHAESPAMVLGAYNQVIDHLLPKDVPYIITGRRAFMNNLDMKRSKGHQNTCQEPTFGKNVISLLPPLNTFLTPLQFRLNEITSSKGAFVVCIFEKEDDLLQFNSALSTGAPRLRFVRIMIRKQWGPREIMGRLVEVQKLAMPDIILHSYDLDYITVIIEWALELNMVTYLYRWYLTYPDIAGLPSDLKELFHTHTANVTGFQLVNGAVLDKAFTSSGNRLSHAVIHDAMKLLVETLNPNDTRPPTFDEMKHTLKINFNGSLGTYGEVNLVSHITRETHVCRIRSEYDWMAYEGGEFNKIGSYLHVQSKKRWVLSLLFGTPKPFKLKTPKLTYKAKPNFKMPIFNINPVWVAAVDDPPLVIEKEDGTYTGVMVDYLDEYSKKLNFTYEITKIVRHDEGAGGRRYVKAAKTLWTGAVSEILEQDAVLAVGAIGTTIEREAVMDFSETTMPGVISLLAKKPAIDYDTWQFLSPFSWQMWLGIGAVLVVVSIIVTFLDLIDKSTHDFKNFPVRDSFYYTASILFFGSTDQRPNSTPMRLLIGFFIFFAIVVSQSYVANMAAFLTTRRNDDNLPKTIDALSRQSAVPFGLMASGEAMALLVRATKGPYLYLRNKFEVEGLQHPTQEPSVEDGHMEMARRFFDYEEALSLVKNGSFIFISESPITRYFIHKDCDLIAIDQDTDSLRYAIGMPKGALFRRELDRVITEVREEVVRDIEIMEKWYRMPECEQGHLDAMANLKTKPLLWAEMKGLFITLGIGGAMAVVAAIIGQIQTWILKRHPKTPKKRKEPNAGEVVDSAPVDNLTEPEPPRTNGGMSASGTSAHDRPLQMTPLMDKAVHFEEG